MSKFSIKSVSSKVKVPSKKTILIVGASLLLVAIIVVSLAAYQVSRQNKAEQDRKAAAATTAQITSLQKQVKAEQAKNQVLQTQKTAACSNYKALSTAKATRSLVTTPVAVGCPQ